MATQQEADQAIIDQVATLAPRANPGALLKLAEALAWVKSPHQSHGGGVEAAK